MKAVRYYTKHEDHIAIHDDPYEANSRMVAMEFNTDMKAVRKTYKGFRLLKAWG